MISDSKIFRLKQRKVITILLILYLALIHLVILALFTRPHIITIVKQKFGFSTPEISKFYNTMLAFQLRADGNLPDDSVIIIGDSITQGLCVVAITNKGCNYGIGGDTTFGVLHRINKYHSLAKARAVILAIGINDIPKRDNDSIVTNFKKIIELIPKTTKIIISAILPVDEKVVLNYSRSNSRIKDLNGKLELMCSIFENCCYFNSGKKMVDNTGNLNSYFHIGDGAHLNKVGYTIWINDIKKALDDCCAEE